MDWTFFCNGSNFMDFSGSMLRICGAGATGAGTFCPEPEPSVRFSWSRSRSQSRNAFPDAEPSTNFHGSASLPVSIGFGQNAGRWNRSRPIVHCSDVVVACRHLSIFLFWCGAGNGILGKYCIPTTYVSILPARHTLQKVAVN